MIRRWRLDKQAGIFIQDPQGPIVNYKDVEPYITVATEAATYVPTDEDWPSGADALEWLCEILDQNHIPRPKRAPIY